MDEILIFFQQHGLWLTVIAVVGIILLGILKYANAFSKLSEKVRHAVYLIITVGLSIVGSVIYLACTGILDIAYIFTVAGAILALNQAFYSIYSNTSLKDLLAKIGEWIKEKRLKKQQQETIDNKEKEE